MDPKTILKAFITAAVKYLPFPFNLLGGVLLDVLLASPVVAAPPTAFAAPDQLKKWLTDYLTQAANSIERPILKRMMTLLINLVGPLSDEVWDNLFGGGTTTTTKFVQHTPTIVDEDVLEAEAAKDLESY